MKLHSLVLDNFQGIRRLTLDLGGQSCTILGDNATGKTTLFNAVTWLLFDKASTGAKNFSPKTKGADGDLHNLVHSVEATFSLDVSGQRTTLKKQLQETYTKKRGSTTEEFTGHTVSYFIDGVPTKETDYNRLMHGFCGGEAGMRLLMMPHYFAETLPWDNRREILLEVCGNITDEAVIAHNRELNGLKSYLMKPGGIGQFYTVEEFQKVAKASMTKINKEIQAIPSRIDEATKAIPDTAGTSLEAAKLKAQELRAQIDTHKGEIAALQAGAASSPIRERLSQAKMELGDARANYVTQTAKTNEAAYADVNRLKAERLRIMRELDNLNYTLQQAQSSMESMTTKRSQLFTRYAEVQAREWTGDTTCPTCGQELPAGQVEEAKAAFNLEKSKELEHINILGQKECSKTMIDEAQARASAIEAQTRSLEVELGDIEEKIVAAQNSVEQPAPFEGTEEYAAMTARIAELEAVAAGEGNLPAEEIKAIQGKIAGLQAQLDNCQEIKSRFQLADQQKQRIKELKAQEKQLASDYEALEHGVYLCEQFTKTKVSMLTESINGKFRSVSFRLFQDQVNGGIKEDCEVMVPSPDGKLVPYAFANNAARINAGLEIIETLSRHWGYTMPVFVDNAESVTRLLPVDTQVIRLVVSEADKKLRLELDGADERAAG